MSVPDVARDGADVTELADQQRALNRRKQAQDSFRYRFELQYQALGVEESLQLELIAVAFGIRKRVWEYFGIAAQLTGGWGSMSLARGDDPSIPSSAHALELAVQALPYFGPFGRFYVAPTALMGWRHYSEPRIGTPDRTTELGARLLREFGGRFGVRLLNCEQLDLSVQFTSSFDRQTSYRIGAALAYELF